MDGSHGPGPWTGPVGRGPGRDPCAGAMDFDPWAGAMDKTRGPRQGTLTQGLGPGPMGRGKGQGPWASDPRAGARDGTHRIIRARRPLMDPIAPYMANKGPIVPDGHVWAYSIQ
jgi:hypothetical protein